MSKTLYRICRLTAVALFVVGMTACSLDEHPQDQIDEEKIYTSADALYQHAVASLYSFVGGNTDGQV